MESALHSAGKLSRTMAVASGWSRLSMRAAAFTSPCPGSADGV